MIVGMVIGMPRNVSPSLNDIGVSKDPVVFGDVTHFVVRRCVSENKRWCISNQKT
jgi:hypothetical protein